LLNNDLYENHKKWLFPNHSFYFHDDDAVDALLRKPFKEFPHLADFAACLPSGAAKADVWRYVLLWEYGGIYTDVDQAPGKYFNSSSIQADDDSYFVVEQGHMLSQYFAAVSPRHPLAFLAVQAALFGLYRVDDVGNQYVPMTTGPNALKLAFKHFMGDQQGTQFDRVKAGHYIGLGNRSTTVVGLGGKASNDWIDRFSLPLMEKKEHYRVMGMKHFDDARKISNDSCWQRLYTSKFSDR